MGCCTWDHTERRGANTLPLSGTRKAKWHLSKRRVDKVDEGVIVVVREAPNDKVREEVDRWGAENVWRGVGGLVQSSQPGGAVQSRDPKGDGGVKRVYKYWALVYKHAETQVRKGVGKEPGAAELERGPASAKDADCV